MTVAACSQDRRILPSRLALDRTDDKLPVETLKRLQKEDPKAELVCIIGSDALMRLEDWRHPKALVRTWPYLVCPRPENEDLSAMRAQADALTARGARLTFLPMDPVSAASSRIREGVPIEEDPSLDVSVREFIAARGLYRQEKRIARAEMWLDRLLTPSTRAVSPIPCPWG